MRQALVYILYIIYFEISQSFNLYCMYMFIDWLNKSLVSYVYWRKYVLLVVLYVTSKFYIVTDYEDKREHLKIAIRS